jgi:hypothetical protein
MRAPVLLVCLLVSLSLSAAEIPISRPGIVPMDTRATIGAFPQVVAGDGFLVAWQEAHGYTDGPVQVRTYDADGTPRQELPVTIGGGHTPRAFWNGSEYVVLFGVRMPKYGPWEPIPAVLAVRVRPDGTIVEDSTVTLVMARNSAIVAGVAFDGVNAVAAITYGNTHHQFLLDRDGAVVRDTPGDAPAAAVTLKPGGGFFVLQRDEGSDVAAGGGRLASVAGTSGQWGPVTATIRDADGAELETFTIAERAGPLPRIVWDGSAWLALYAEEGSLCTARFTGAADLARTCAPRDSVYAPSIALGPHGPFMAWADRGQIVTSSGVATTAWSSAIASDAVVDDEGLLVAWIENREIRAGGVFNDGTPRPERRVGTEPQLYRDLRLARARDRTLLVWANDATTYVMDLGMNVPIALGGGSSPAVAVRGGEVTVVWLRGGAVESAHLSKELTVTARESFAGTATQDSPSIAATSSGYLAVWREAENGIARVVVEPLDAGGRRITGGNRLAENEGPIEKPNLACSAAACLVAWYGDREIGYALVRHDGGRISADRFIAVPPDAMTDEMMVRVLGDGSFVIHRGNTFTAVTAAGVAGPTVAWHNQRIGLGNVVTWNGRATAVYVRAAANVGRVFAYQFVPRGRAVRR